MLALAILALGAPTAHAADPCAHVVPAYEGAPVAVVKAPTAFDPVGDLVEIRVGLVRPITLTLGFRLPGDHPALRERSREVALVLDDGALLAPTTAAAGPLAVELQAALVPGLVQVEVPVEATLSTDQVAALAARRVVGVRLVVDPDHTWTLRGGAARKLRAAFGCAASR